MQSDSRESFSAKKSHNFGFLLLCIGIFVLPYAMRGDILGPIAAVNIFALAGLVLLLYKGDFLRSKPMVPGAAIVIGILAAYLVLFSLLYSIFASDTKAGIAFLCSTIIPIALIYSEIDDLPRCLKMWCGFFSLVMVLLAICVIANWFTENEVSEYFANLFHSNTYIKLAGEGRFVSFLGHPLTTSFTAICYTVSMYAYSQCVKKVNPFVYFILAGIVVLACASITGAVILLFLFIAQNYRMGNYAVILVVVGVLLVLWVTGALNSITDRIVTNLANGDITSGRNAALLRMIENGELSFKLFDWQVFSSDNPGLVAATEYPLIRLSYRFGVVTAICFCLLAFVIPLIRILRCRRIDICGTALCLIVMANIFDGIVSSGDLCWVYAVSMMFLVYVAQNATREERDSDLVQKKEFIQ